MTEIIRHCPDCSRDRPFAQHHAAPGCCPAAADGYCPEWICLSCGAGVILGGLPSSFELPRAVTIRDRVA
jgi:hypothetical protein